MVMFMTRTFFVWVALGFVIPYLLGGWTGVLWGGLVRIFLTHHVTWSVNSVCHTFGRRMFETSDESKNQWLVGLLAFGEGWHNNHHAFPRSAFHGLRWWQFDLSAYIIRLLEWTGLAWDVWRVPAESLKARLARSAKADVPTTAQ
jgi:stearoyl-CoA desaturase (delta-9 desaturase)